MKVDLRIKKEMYDIAPSKLKYTDEETIQKYTDELDSTLKYIFSELKCIAIDIFGNESNVLARIYNLEKITKDNFYSCGFDINKLKKFYQYFIINLSF